MTRRVICLVIVVLLLAQPAMAQSTSGGGSSLWDLLRYLQDTFAQLRSWVNSQYSAVADAVRAKIAPITDTAHAARSIASWLESLSRGLPDIFRGLFDRSVARFRDPAAPAPGTVSSAAREMIAQAPNSELATTVRAHEEVSAATDASVARARAAQESAEETSRAVAADASMAINLETASASARELAARATETPSTRAALQLLIEGFAAYMDQNARQNADLSSRITALVQQQASLSQQLTSLTEQTAALVELANQDRKRQAEEQATAARLTVTSAIGGMGAAAGAIASIAPSDERREAEQRMYRQIIDLHGGSR